MQVPNRVWHYREVNRSTSLYFVQFFNLRFLAFKIETVDWVALFAETTKPSHQENLPLRYLDRGKSSEWAWHCNLNHANCHIFEIAFFYGIKSACFLMIASKNIKDVFIQETSWTLRPSLYESEWRVHTPLILYHIIALTSIDLLFLGSVIASKGIDHSVEMNSREKWLILGHWFLVDKSLV